MGGCADGGAWVVLGYDNFKLVVVGGLKSANWGLEMVVDEIWGLTEGCELGGRDG